MKRYKNVTNKKLSIEGRMMVPGEVLLLDEALGSVSFYEKNRMLKFVPLEEEKTIEVANPMTREMSDAHASPVDAEKPQVAEPRASVVSQMPGIKEAKEPVAPAKYKFAGTEDGTVISKGGLPGQGSEKSVSSFIRDGITAGQKDLGSVIDNSAVAVSPEPKKK